MDYKPEVTPLHVDALGRAAKVSVLSDGASMERGVTVHALNWKRMRKVKMWITRYIKVSLVLYSFSLQVGLIFILVSVYMHVFKLILRNYI